MGFAHEYQLFQIVWSILAWKLCEKDLDKKNSNPSDSFYNCHDNIFWWKQYLLLYLQTYTADEVVWLSKYSYFDDWLPRYFKGQKSFHLKPRPMVLLLSHTTFLLILLVHIFVLVVIQERHINGTTTGETKYSELQWINSFLLFDIC